MLDLYQVKATCFFLGYVAQKYPHLVIEAKKRGHEIASHGMFHRLVYKLSREEFIADLLSSKKILEDIISEEVISFRSPSFSVTESIPWFFDALVEAGFKIDSSVFPVKEIMVVIKQLKKNRIGSKPIRVCFVNFLFR